MNFNRIDANDYFPAASLGGLTNGVTTVEMASGYSAIENDGVFREPTCIKKITDSEGNTIVNNNKLRKEKQVYEKNATRMMTSILTGVLKTGTAAGHALSNMACAGKTGTTSDKKDGWFCGFTPYYTTAVWVGYDTPKTLSNLYGSTYPLSIWEDFMGKIHEGMAYEDFKPYDNSSSNGGNYYEDGNNNPPVVTAPPEETREPGEENIDIYEPPEPSEPSETQKPEETDEPEPGNDPDIIPPDDDTEDIPGGNEDDPEDVGNDEPVTGIDEGQDPESLDDPE